MQRAKLGAPQPAGVINGHQTDPTKWKTDLDLIVRLEILDDQKRMRICSGTVLGKLVFTAASCSPGASIFMVRTATETAQLRLVVTNPER